MNKKEYVKNLNNRISIVLDFLLQEKKFKNNNQIAKTLGVSQSNLIAIVKNERSLAIDKLVKLIIISGVDSNWLLLGNGDMFVASDVTNNINQKTGISGINIAGAAGSDIAVNQGGDTIRNSELIEENKELKEKVIRLEKQIDKLFKMLDDK